MKKGLYGPFFIGCRQTFAGVVYGLRFIDYICVPGAAACGVER